MKDVDPTLKPWQLRKFQKAIKDMQAVNEKTNEVGVLRHCHILTVWK